MRILIAMAISVFAATLHAARPEDQLDSFLTIEMERANVPGLAYGIADGDEIQSGMRGVTDAGGSGAIKEDTAFIIGSVSKSFTALAVMQLVEAGLVDLDAPIGNYLEVFNGNKAGSTITVRQLLSHTSGYSTMTGNLSQTDTSMEADALERRVDSIAMTEPDDLPGTKWQYSNANYMLLGRLIEVVSDQSYTDYIESNILAPAGMHDSFVHASEIHERLATGHWPWFAMRRALDQNLTGLGSAAQGGVVSTGRDMATYLAMMMNGEDDLISAAGKVMMMSPASDVSPNYGFGWSLETERGVVTHSGSNPGYEALVVMVPSRRLGAAVLVNAGGGIGYGDTSHLRYGFASMALGLAYEGSPAGMGAKSTMWLLGLGALTFVLASMWAWRKRAALRVKSGWLGRFSIWFPLLAATALAFVLLRLVPSLFGAPLSTIGLFAPDLWLLLIACSVTGLGWALWRLALAYWPRIRSASPG